MKKLLFLLCLTLYFVAPKASAAGGACPTAVNPPGAGTFAANVTFTTLGITNCYYIASSGSDSNSGTSEAAPWAHLPGMSTCSANCAALAPLPGQGFIFRGGDTWNGSNLGVVWAWSGSSVSPIYIGVDKAWFTGGSWTRPIWTCGGIACSGATSSYFFGEGTNRSYIIVDNIEVTGLFETSTSHPNYFNACGTNNIFENIYVHGWSNNLTSGPVSQAFGVGCGQPNQGLTLRYNVVDGSDTPQNSMYMTHGNTPISYGNVMRYVQSGTNGCGDVWHDNLVEYLIAQVGGGHADGLYQYSQCYSPNSLIYNNIVRHVLYPGSGGAVKFWLNGNNTCPFASCTSYAFNNIIYDNLPGNVVDTGGHFSGNYGIWYIFNNTFDCGTDSSPGNCILGDNGNQQGGVPANATMSLLLSNNHWLQAGTSSVFSCAYYTCTESTPVYQTVAQANAQGYNDTGTYAFQPTVGTGSTVHAGTNETSTLCAAVTSIDSFAGASCVNGTTYGVSYNVTNHSVSYPSLTQLARGSTWDVGAYQFNGTPTVSSPVYSPVGGTYGPTQSVTITVASPAGSTILYCQDTTNTCTPSITYSSAINVSATGYIRAFATHSSYTQSATSSSFYQIGGNVIQHTFNRCTSGATCSVAFQNAVTSGDFIIAAGRDGNAKNLNVTFSDGTNTYTQALFNGKTYCSLNSDEDTLGVSYAVVTGPSKIYTVTMSDGGLTVEDKVIEIVEVSGINSVDQTACNNLTNTALTSTNTSTTTTAKELLFGFVGTSADNQITLTPGSGYTGLDLVANTGTFYYAYDEYQNVLSLGAYAATFTQSISQEAAVVIVTFAQGSGSGTPNVSLTPASASFSTNQNVASASQPIILTNTGSGNLSVTAVSAPALYSETGSGLCAGAPPYTLTPTQSCSFGIIFTPTTTGTFTGNFSLTDNASGSPHLIALSGLGTVPVPVWVPTTYAFGNVSTSSPTSSSFLVLQNNGNGPLNVSLSYTGTNPTLFTTASTTCPATLQAGGNCNVTVLATPVGAGSFSANLTNTDSVQGLTTNLGLTMTGVITQATLPVASPVGGNYTSSQNVTLTAVGFTICYRLDGGQPTASVPGTCDSNGGLEFTYSTSIPISTATILTFIGTLTGDANSSIGSATYTFGVLAPVFALVSGSAPNPQTYSITSASGGVTIWYTLNGVSPVCGSYGGQLTNGGSLTINVSTLITAVACSGTISSSPVTQTVLVHSAPIAAVAPAINLL